MAAQRWSVEQVAAAAPNARSMTAAEAVAHPGRWNGLGCDARTIWGRFSGSGAEPYETMVDHVEAAWRCTCPSRQHPCKHALGLLLMWVRGQVADGVAGADVAAWIAGRDAKARAAADGLPIATDSGSAASGTDSDANRDSNGDLSGDSSGDLSGDSSGERDAAPPEGAGTADQARNERVARMMAGLIELDRWLEDRMRTGLADPAIARFETWDGLASRLVDAQAGSLANRVRRVAGLVGASPDWHDRVLAEIGLLHLLAVAARRVPELPEPLADAVAMTSGWQVRKADVLAGVPDTDDWLVAGRSDQREDRIEVRRHWLRGLRSGRWAMLLSFAAYQQSLDESMHVGQVVHADLHRYPGASLRALMGRRDEFTTDRFESPYTTTIAQACDEIGRAVCAEPWLERYPAIVLAAPTVADGRWVIADDTGSLPVVGTVRSLATLAAAAADGPVAMTVEWTPLGVQPLTVYLADRTLDIGPTADASFVIADLAERAVT